MKPETILVRGVNWIGDAVMTMPAIQNLKKAFSSSRISLLVKPSVAALFQGCPHVDEMLLYEDNLKGLLGKLKLAQSLRGRRFARAYLLQNAFDAALLSFLAGIPERIGYNRDGRGFLLTRPVSCDHDDRKVHHIRYYLNLLRAVGVKTEDSAPWIYLDLAERLSARGRLSALRRPILGINPGAAYGSAKRWLPERFAEVAHWFVRDMKGSVIIFGGKNEMDIAGQIEYAMVKSVSGAATLSDRDAHDAAREALVNLGGRTTLRELISLISECDVLLSNDSGPMHIGYAVGTPVVALFGSTDPQLTGPPEEGNVIIKTPLPCSPCFERTCPRNHLDCMEAITPDEVYFGIKEALPQKRAVFFDRDGTLCRDANYLRGWNEFEVFPETVALRTLKDNGIALIGISNQSGIGRGIVKESFVREVNRVFLERYGFDDFFYCPHIPEDRCSCRKPEPGLIAAAKAKHRIDPRQSFIVGDKDADMLLAKAVGAKGILVTTGQQKDSSYADHVVNGLKAAVDVIMKEKQ